jgi:hypothetical protein
MFHPPVPALLRPDRPSEHTLPRITCKNPLFSYTNFRNSSINNDLRQSESPCAAKTITGNNQWPNSGKSRVQHVRLEGMAVFSFRSTTDRVQVFIKWVFRYPLAGAAWQLPHLKSIRDFRIVIAITIPIKNRSGKIGDRFSFRIRSAIFRSKSDPGFFNNRPPAAPPHV